MGNVYRGKLIEAVECGQDELSDGLRHSHLQGWQGGPAGEHLHQGLQDQILDSPR